VNNKCEQPKKVTNDMYEMKNMTTVPLEINQVIELLIDNVVLEVEHTKSENFAN
jgi:hypothetical protein